MCIRDRVDGGKGLALRFELCVWISVSNSVCDLNVIVHLICCLVVVCDICIFQIVQLCLVFYF